MGGTGNSGREVMRAKNSVLERESDIETEGVAEEEKLHVCIITRVYIYTCV
jgi:hypothetical protein